MVSLSAFCLAALASIHAVDAHGRMSKPAVVFSGPYPDSPVDQIDGYKALPPSSGLSYSGSPERNTAAFTTAFQGSAYPTLRAFVLQHQAKDVRACGASTVDGVARQLLPAKVEFSFRAGEGFVPDHQGPCELWCGNATRVFHDANCAKTFRDGPALLPYDRAACDGSAASVMTFYWLALHLPKWQLYINCAAVSTAGGGGGGGGGVDGSAAATKVPPTGPTGPTNWGSDSDSSTTSNANTNTPTATKKPMPTTPTTPMPTRSMATPMPQASCRVRA